jgi:flagellar M-ring protein FliF
MNAIVQEAIGFDKKRGDKVSIKPFKFLKNAKSKGIDDKKEEDTSDMANDMNSMFIKSIMQDFGEYIQYIISIILLFIFYKNFISKNEISMPSDSLSKDGKSGAIGGASGGIDFDDIAEEDYSFNSSVAKSRLKAKIKSEIFNNLDGLDEESAVKYEVLIEELDREVHSKPEDIASMIEMLLFESNEK